MTARRAALRRALRVEHAAMRTSVGLVREGNEDAAYVDEHKRYFIIADGMGGHAAGEVASALAVNAIRDVLDTAADAIDALASLPVAAREQRARLLVDAAIRGAHRRIVAFGQMDRSTYGMGTTVDVALLIGRDAYVGHVGDSRTYLLRGGKVCSVTSDHTLVQAMVRAGTLTEEQARVAPIRNALCSVLGMRGELTIEHQTLHLEPGDQLLMTTDGLHGYFTDEELATSLGDDAPDRALDSLIERACRRGGADNLTGIAMTFVEAEAQPELDAARRARRAATLARFAPRVGAATERLWCVDDAPRTAASVGDRPESAAPLC